MSGLTIDDAWHGAEPWPVFARFRKECPVWWSAQDKMFYVFRYKDVRDIFLDPRFTVEYRFRITEQLFGRTLIDMEGAEHQRLRKLLATSVLNNDNLSCFATGAAEPHIRRIVDEAAREPRFDFISKVAARVPTVLTCEFLGIPLSEERWLFQKMMVLMNHLGGSATNFAASEQVHREIDAWLDRLIPALIAERGRECGYKRLIDAVWQESPETIRIIYWTFLAGGIETSMCLLGNAMAILTKHPEWFARLAQDKAMARSILIEILRYEPVQGSTVRFASEDIEIAGVRIRQGQALNLVVASACRDEEAYPEPDRFDPHRSSASSLSFAIGPHACLGRNFTLTNAEIALRTVWDRFGGAVLASAERPAIEGSMFRLPKQLIINQQLQQTYHEDMPITESTQ